LDYVHGVPLCCDGVGFCFVVLFVMRCVGLLRLLFCRVVCGVVLFDKKEGGGVFVVSWE
jgi:hypothetical protein